MENFNFRPEPIEADFSGRKLYFPQITTFDQIFSAVTTCITSQYGFTYANEKKSVEYIGYAVHEGNGFRKSYTLRTRPFMANFLLDNMVIKDDYYFNLISREDGRTLITINYNKICGSRMLAFIRTDSIPQT